MCQSVFREFTIAEQKGNMHEQLIGEMNRIFGTSPELPGLQLLAFEQNQNVASLLIKLHFGLLLLNLATSN